MCQILHIKKLAVHVRLFTVRDSAACCLHRPAQQGIRRLETQAVVTYVISRRGIMYIHILLGQRRIFPVSAQRATVA